ncbi:MgtC/SapB family protein [Pseudosulfitobacter koreensis]|uniref:Protein MgtC n=1 Tax=Pseudosulfitobacter koreensis TaxID=2968472 RepID=A0ABT1YYE9_9RHOB|nr:MgtC/SapB family protein [Pseudosulfitobacter koreense]MCR8825920.1 MgtC/SapB family protein [Pseudosulfitobacter koreense]
MLDTIWDELNGSFTEVPPAIATIRLIAALVLGGIVGFEREVRKKPAGLRTHMLVSMAACLFIIVSQQLSSMSFGTQSELQVDPLRLIEAVTAGVAFLAAGIIFTSGGEVKNTTTGASMWLSGAIGLACGSGQMPLAAIATLLVVIVMVLLRVVERWMGTH